MTPEQAINTIWPAGNPNIRTARISACVEKIRGSLNKHGFICACHGSYSHLAMEIVAEDLGLRVEPNPGTETVTLDGRR